MKKIKISAVSYTNTFPFIYGIENSDILKRIELSKDIPSACAKKLINNEVDIGLIPVAVIPKLNYSKIITNYCIGASGSVRSVILGSYKPFNEISTICLDYQSRSSVMLTRILAKRFWKIDVKWENTTEGFESRLNKDKAFVIIGDRALFAEKKFPFVIDLAKEWIKFTNLPFVFAAWVANKKIESEFINNFNIALNKGVNSIHKLPGYFDFLEIPGHIKPIDYLTKNIDFKLDDKKKEGLDLFLTYAKEFEK